MVSDTYPPAKQRPAAISDTIFLRLNAKFALGADDLQWILYRSRREAPSPLDAPLKFGRGSEWLPVSFVRSSKDILFRCMREKGCKPCDEAKVALAMLPCTFDAWKPAERARRASACAQREATTMNASKPVFPAFEHAQPSTGAVLA